MILKHLALQNFRSYTKQSFDFIPGTTVVIGPNTAGKSNLIESISFLSTGKSFRAEKDSDAIAFEQEVAWIKGVTNEDKLDLMLAKVVGREAPLKKYLLNGVSKRRVDFAGHIGSVLFSPLDLEIVAGSPGKRRGFLNSVLEQVDREYRLSLVAYEKALRQRNALLELARETGRRNEDQFTYWDGLLIENGQQVTAKRQAFIDFINSSEKEVFDVALTYDHSMISPERLLQYKDAELGAGVTLVGPHRDDVLIDMKDGKSVKSYGSRGQQRLAILQLKLLQLIYMEQALSQPPLLLLDDIFSELDEGHIDLVLSKTNNQQTILTTTHEEFVAKALKDVSVIELK